MILEQAGRFDFRGLELVSQLIALVGQLSHRCRLAFTGNGHRFLQLAFDLSASVEFLLEILHGLLIFGAQAMNGGFLVVDALLQPTGNVFRSRFGSDGLVALINHDRQTFRRRLDGLIEGVDLRLECFKFNDLFSQSLVFDFQLVAFLFKGRDCGFCGLPS